MHIRPSSHAHHPHRHRQLVGHRTLVLSIAVLSAVGLLTVPGVAAAAAATTPASPSPSSTAAAARVPVAPFVTDVTPVGLGLAVAWNPSPVAEQVTGYTVTATPKTTTVVAGCSPVAQTVQVAASDSATVVAGLCAKVLYTVRMTATNAAGTSPLTPAWSPATPLVAQVPVAPAVTSVIPRDGQAIVAWAAPVDTGGTPVTSYTVTATPVGAAAGNIPTSSVTTDPDIRTATLGGLTNGTAYALNVVAISTVGASPAGTITVTPRPAYAPTAPTGLATTPSGTGTITTSWAAPTDNGGTPVTGYTLTWQQAGYRPGSGTTPGRWTPTTGSQIHTATVAPGTDPTDPTSTAASVSYTVPADQFEQPTAAYLFTVTASNAAGTSPAAATTAGISPTVGVKKTTVVLTADTLTALTRVTTTTLTWPNPAPTQITQLKTGQTLVADTTSDYAPNGFLRTITAIKGRTGGTGTNTTLTTIDAALTDAFTNTSVAASVNPLADATTTAAGAPTGSPTAQPGTQPATSAAKTRFTPAMPGVTVADTAINSATGTTAGKTAGGTSIGGAAGIGGGVSITASITLNIEVNTGPIKIEGAVTVTPTVGFELNLSTNAIGLPNGLRVSQTARVAAQTQITTTINGEKKIKIGEIPGAPIPIGPVVIQPKIPIYLVIAGTASITTTTGMAIGASLGWDSRNPTVLTGKNLSTAPTMTGAPDPGSVTVGGSIGLALEPAMTLYGIAGPFIAAQLDLKAEGTPNPAPGQPYFTLTPQLSFKLGLRLDLFGTNADVSLTLATITFSAFTITTAPTATYTITPPTPAVAPGNTVQLTATRTDGGSTAKTWTLTGGTSRDKITSTGLLTAGPTTNRTLTAQVQDGTGATGQTRITIGTPLDPPGNPQAVANIDGSATITWTAPTNTGGSPIKSYTVLTTPDTGTHTIPATTTTITIPGVTAGAYIAIYATNTTGVRSPAATGVLADKLPAMVAAGSSHSCVVTTGGGVYCWGKNTYGQLGDGTTRNSNTPVLVAGLPSAAVAITASNVYYDYDSTCAVLRGGSVWCWGYNGDGELGDGTRTARRLPVQVAGITNAVSVAAGYVHACALLSTGRVKCWGSNYASQLGAVSAPSPSLTPVDVYDVEGATQISSREDHTCARLVSGLIKCWGSNRYGQLGTGSSGGSQLAGLVSGVSSAISVAAGSNHTCAVLSDQTVRCWGQNALGQLGDGTTINRNLPVKVANVSDAVAVSAGGGMDTSGFTCVRRVSGVLSCVGENSSGQLGIGVAGAPTTVIENVHVDGAVNTVALGVRHGCLISTTGSLACWGQNYNGELGDGTFVQQDTPSTVAGF